MSQKRRWFLSATLLVVLAIVLSFLAAPSRLPVYEGKNLAEWFARPELDQIQLMHGMPGGPGGQNPAYQAILELRGDAVPYLVQVARKRPNAWNRAYAKFTQALPSGLTRLLPRPLNEPECRKRQCRALVMLGSLAFWEGPSAPFGKSHPPVAIAELIAVLRESMQDPSPQVRQAAVAAAATLRTEAVPLIPELQLFLSSTNRFHRVEALEALGAIGRAASNSVELVSTLVTNAETYEQSAAARALGQIGFPSRQAALAFAPLLNSPDVWVQRDAALALAQMNCVPESAIPRLRELTNSPPSSQQAGVAATMALWALAADNPRAIGCVSNMVWREPRLGLYFGLCPLSNNPLSTNLLPCIRQLQDHPDPHVKQSAEELVRYIESRFIRLGKGTAAPPSKSEFPLSL